MLIGARLAQANISIQAHDEARNFLALVAYRSYAESGSACLSRAAFEESLAHFEEQFLSSKAALRKMAVGPFLIENEDFYQFHEEYLWYFLCARYAVKSLQVQDQAKYVEFVRNCTANIFQRKFANIAIFIAYFSNDKLPFINAKIGDSENIDNLEVAIDRIHIFGVLTLFCGRTVIGQILSGRSGTFSAALVLECITRMVKASGRYVSLNHAIAAVLIYDKEKSVEEVGRAMRGDHLTPEEKYERVTRIFAFWSVYLAHAGLARYLNQEHSIRALGILSDKHESEDTITAGGNVPFNFTFVKIVANLYNSGGIDRNEIDAVIQKYDENSSIVALLRVVIHMYAYYMPLDIEDKQWVSQKLRMPLRKIEMQRLKAITADSKHRATVK